MHSADSNLQQETGSCASNLVTAKHFRILKITQIVCFFNRFYPLVVALIFTCLPEVQLGKTTPSVFVTLLYCCMYNIQNHREQNTHL